MYPPIFKIFSGDSTVTDIFGSDPIRIFPFGNAPSGIERPYAVWRVFSGSPTLLLDTSPDMDEFYTQIDVYAEIGSSAMEAAKVLRDVLEEEKSANIVAWRGEVFDPDSDLYKYSFDVNFLTLR